MFIDSVVAGVVANIVCETTKKGFSLTKDYLVRELAKAIKADQAKLEHVADEIVKIDQREDLEELNEKGVIKRMSKYPELVELLNTIKQENVQNITNQYHFGNGDNVGGDKYC
ncbi:hypothetical protein F0A17_01055 [Billgrantia pellis]|uniref:Uncharacterized protein n=1 Tax=Billgrantia pellis TaxID=2606936 RepID=A0A7V7G2B6_9GAMM|nr:hypothetical protein [Halomonas pellis]KAA0014278.1 hypothetical protein F0A17_01055 [Halomonas pellis]